MEDSNSYSINTNVLSKISGRVGFYSALSLSVITAITFAFALTATPISGANCPGGCIEYPYLITFPQFPDDFMWMYFAMLQAVIYPILVVSIHEYVVEQKKIFSRMGLSFARITAVILLIDYYLQLAVIPASLKSGETLGYRY